MFLLFGVLPMLFCNFVFGSEKGGARLVILREKQEMLWKIKQILMKTTQKKHAKI